MCRLKLILSVKFDVLKLICLNYITLELIIVFKGFIGSGELKVSLEKYFNEYLERFSRELRTLAKKFKVKCFC